MNVDMQERLFSITYTGLITLFFLAIAYKMDFFKLEKKHRFAELNFSDVVGAFCTFIFVQLILSPLLITAYYYYFEQKSLLELRVLGETKEAWLAIFNNVILLFCFGLYCYVKREKVKTFFGEKLLFSDFLVGVLAWFLCMPLASFLGEMIELMLSLFRLQPVDQTAVQHLKKTTAYPFLFLSTSLMVVTIVPLIEEMIFRGFLQTWLRQKLGVAGAIATTSLIFALFHFSSQQSYDNVLILSILFTVSCFMGFVYERQKSLLASIGLHATFNALTTFSIFFSNAIQ